MANEKVALSQDEVDKLMGLIPADSPAPKSKKKLYKIDSFLNEQQFSELREVCKNVYKYFKLSLRKKFGEPKIRKLTITSLDHQNVNEFFDSVTDNDFIYEAKFGRAKAYIKLDSFLFGALSGMKIDTKHKINVFQAEVLKEFVACFLVEGFARQLDKAHKIAVTSLFEKNKNSFRKGKTGVCVSINWNENLRSFGIEKVFLSKELIELMRAVS